MALVIYSGTCSVYAQRPAPDKSAKSKVAASQKKGGIAAALKKWDANGDGLLQKAEIPDASRGKVDAWARNRKLDPEKPLKIERLLSGDAANAKKNRKGAKKATKERKTTSEGEKAPGEGSKLAFGQQGTRFSAKAKVNGFGKSEQPNADPKADKTPSAQSSNEEDDKKAEMRKRFARLAKSMMFQHDKNRNGKLERSEWARLKGDPGAFDRDGDGSLSMSELTDKLAGFGSREKDVTARRKARREAYGKSKSKKSSYRFLTAHERLPKGLPDWFIEKDENEDGQLSLHEFAPEKLTASEVRKFQQFDLNRDGILVAREYLKSTGEK